MIEHTHTSPSARARLVSIGSFVAPLLLSGIAFSGVIEVAFHHDDYLHLYDIVNLGPGLFCLTNFGGHLQITPNAVSVALHALFGMDARWSMAAVLLTHLLNVALLVSVIRNLTGNWAVASVAAAWWGASAMNSAALGWFSVYGQVLSVAFALWVVRLITGAARRPLAPTAPFSFALALLAAATSFGTGLAMTLSMPLVVGLLLPEARARARLVRAAAIAALGSVVLYVALDRLGVWLLGIRSATMMLPLLRGHVGAAIGFFAQLVMSGTAIALAGPYFLPLHALGGWTTPLACIAALALLVLARPPWRTVVACLLLSLAPYGMIALARYMLAVGNVAEPALAGRYHYAAPLGVVLALATAAAAALDRIRSRARARALFMVVGYAAAIVAYVRFFPPMPRYEEVQRQVAVALAKVDAAIRSSPPGADVYIRHQPFFISDLTSIRIGQEVFDVPPGRFPGVAALFALYHASDVVAGRRVFFVVDDPLKLAAWQRGRRGAGLVVSGEEMRARGGSLRE